MKKCRRSKIRQFLEVPYSGTKYEELKLTNGKTLKSVEVTGANPRYVSMMHSMGVANVNYKDLPDEIRKACKYDPELEQLEIERIESEKEARKKHLSSLKDSAAGSTSKVSKNLSNRSAVTSNRTPSKNVPEKKQPVKPKGYIKVRVVGVRKGNKTIEITGIANVDGTLYLNDYTWRRYTTHRVYAGKKFSRTWRSVGSKYDVKLKAKTGELLDSEAHNKKSGLGGVDGF